VVPKSELRPWTFPAQPADPLCGEKEKELTDFDDGNPLVWASRPRSGSRGWPLSCESSIGQAADWAETPEAPSPVSKCNAKIACPRPGGRDSRQSHAGVLE